MSNLILEVWNLKKEQDPHGARFEILYKHLDLQSEEAWAFVRSLPQEELVLLRLYAEKQVQPQQALPTTDFSVHSAAWIAFMTHAQSDEQTRHQHTLARLQGL